ncbi:MAG: ArsR/SmtB family transcription factor [Thermoplasmata archaeon]
MNDDIDDFITAFENSTRREIIKLLTQFERSYALEISRATGISQQAINKQLDLLEKCNLVTSSGFVPSEYGAKRKIYEPTGFSTVVIDYARNFFSISRVQLDDEKNDYSIIDRHDAIRSLIDIQKDLDSLMNERSELIKKKDRLIYAITKELEKTDRMTRNIVADYLDSFDVDQVSEDLSLPVDFVKKVLNDFGFY